MVGKGTSQSVHFLEVSLQHSLCLFCSSPSQAYSVLDAIAHGQVDVEENVGLEQDGDGQEQQVDGQGDEAEGAREDEPERRATMLDTQKKRALHGLGHRIREEQGLLCLRQRD